jgi:hypothetical protein
MTPLEIIHNHIQDADIAFLPRLSPPVHYLAPRLGWEVERRRIRGCSQVGKRLRRPYIEVAGRHYTNDEMQKQWDLIGHYGWVHTRRRDMRIEAYAPNGVEWGELTPNGGAKGHPVSLDALKRAQKGRNQEDWPPDAAIDDQKENLANEAAEDALDRPRNVSDAATELAKLQWQDQQRRQSEARSEAALPASDARPHRPRSKASQEDDPGSFDPIPALGQLRSH